MIHQVVLSLVLMVAAGCQPTVRLMPTPAVFSTGEHNPFAANPSLDRSNLVHLFYATNRAPLGPRGSRVYTILPTQTLYFGTADVRIGPRGKPWDSLMAHSTSNTRKGRPVLQLEAMDESAHIKAADDAAALSPEARRYFEGIDAEIERSQDKDITVYVHGSNSTVETAAAQAAQYLHFTGRNSVVLLFAWPSAGNGLRYFTDVQHARLSIPLFARLIELLDRHTKAEHINVLAYSAGAQIISAGLAQLGQRHARQTNQSLRLGEIYYAAPDVAFPTFVAQLPHYVRATRRITVSINLNDAVLGISAWFQGVSRLGRPDPNEISAAESRWLIEAAADLNFDVVSVEPDVIPGLGRRAHAFWYDHPWVSSDVMMKLLFHAPPSERGLQPGWTEQKFRYWTFPPDYDQRIIEILHGLGAPEGALQPALKLPAEIPSQGTTRSPAARGAISTTRTTAW